ncbi:MAG: sigma-54 dependent transcriptional regulator [Bacteroidetes bacterium]|nr:sigma-54 dependent transcriptional regulator [Bacteroidota bacterium]
MNINTDAEHSNGQLSHIQTLTVLVIDDEKLFTEELHEFLQRAGFNAIEANTAGEGLQVLKKEAIDLLILDIRLPGVSGLEVLKEVKQDYPNLEVIMVSGHGDMDSVIEAMHNGAIDFLRKPFRHIDIRIAIERTRKFLLLQQKIRQIEEKNSLISQQLQDRIERQLIGVSKQMVGILDMAMTAARFADTNVLITGESGTGKENVARIVHFASSRKDNAFMAVNSSAITDSLLESEFFGHKKGSFTGALADKKGFFEVCNKGTLFLDEIADMPVNLQAKVLRATEEKKITRVGDTRQIITDFRIISATNRNLDTLVAEKTFRLDLLHRLNTLHIHIPPLREHPDDIEPLLRYFVTDFSVKFNKPIPGIQKEVFMVLRDYDFPGNVRELKNMTERAIILFKDNTLGINDFPIKKQTIPSKSIEIHQLNLEQQETESIRQALLQSGYNQVAAARLLGISRDALIRKMKKYHISVKKAED